MKFYHYFTLFVALTISACAAYYSIIGLTAIFAASVIPIIIMGSVLELAKITGAIWLKIYWQQAGFLLKLYLVPAIGVLMLITSMGIFGFLSKAHIEQTANAAEGLAQIERIDTEVVRQQTIISRAEQRIAEAEASTVNNNANIQSQIDAEQSRIDSAYSRIQPAIDEQLLIIENARADADSRLKPYNDEIASVDNQLIRLEQQAADIESRLDNLELDSTVITDLQQQISGINENITKVTNQLNSTQRDQVRAAQAAIGVSSDGLLGGNTRRALASWTQSQQARILQLQEQIVDARSSAQQFAASERSRLTDLVNSLRGEQSTRLQERRDAALTAIDDLQSQEPAVAIAARDEIARIRKSADQQIAASQELIQRLRSSLTIGNDESVEDVVDQQLKRIATANVTVDELTEQKYQLEIQARALEAEVGPIKYVAELIYGTDAGSDLLEESVRWMILLLVAVFDPLAVILTLAAVSGISGFRNQKKRNNIEIDTKIKEVEVPVEVIKEVENTDKINSLSTENTELALKVKTQQQIIDLLNEKQTVRKQPVAEPDFDLGDVSGASFGTTWPVQPSKGQLFLKVDILPNKLYKWNSRKWIEVDIDRVDDTLAYDKEYIKYLLMEVKHGRREYEELTEIEQSQIKGYIREHGRNQDIE